MSDPIFLEKASENTLEIYQRVMWNVQARFGPVIEVFEVEGSRERRLVIGYKTGGTKKFFSALSNLYHLYSLYSARKYVGACAAGCDRADRAMLTFGCRAILERDHDHLALPQPPPRCQCAPD